MAVVLRRLSLPPGDQAWEIVDAPTAIGRRLTNAVAYDGRAESTVLLEETETLDTELIQEEEAERKVDAEKDRPGHHVHRPVTARQRRARVLGGMEEGRDLGGHQISHGLQPGGI